MSTIKYLICVFMSSLLLLNTAVAGGASKGVPTTSKREPAPKATLPPATSTAAPAPVPAALPPRKVGFVLPSPAVFTSVAPLVISGGCCCDPTVQTVIHGTTHFSPATQTRLFRSH